MQGDDLFLDLDLRDAALAQMEPSQFDELPFGAIKLDAQGKVVLYNRFESELARREVDDVLGRSFFAEIAPCTNNNVFRGELDRLIARGGKNARFDYKFHFKWGERAVRIQFWVPTPNERWIFVLPKAAETAVSRS